MGLDFCLEMSIYFEHLSLPHLYATFHIKSSRDSCHPHQNKLLKESVESIYKGFKPQAFHKYKTRTGLKKEMWRPKERSCSMLPCLKATAASATNDQGSLSYLECKENFSNYTIRQLLVEKCHFLHSRGETFGGNIQE